MRQARAKLGTLERAQIAFIQRSFEPGRLDRVLRWCQRHVGATWIHHSTKHVRRVHGLDRLPALDARQSFIVVSNHRSFFDLYVVTAHLVRAGLRHRIFFPVRGAFFYDTPAGFFVNGVMSFFAMYPPLFRDPKKAAVNLASLDEVTRLLRRGGALVGLHPEGTRKQDGEPYDLLPAQRGVGRIIRAAGVPVIPVFVNGLCNDLVRQVSGNFDGTGEAVHVVFGAPIDFGDLLGAPRSPKTEQAIADRALQAIARLGAEERALRCVSPESD